MNPDRKIQIAAFCVLIFTLAIFSRHYGQKEGVGIEKHDDYLVLKLEPKSPEPISQWTVAVGKDNFIIGQVSNLPLQGNVNELSALVLNKAAQVVIASGESPLGVSFRENKCTGLLQTFQNFIPPLVPACQNCTGTTTLPEYNVCVEAYKFDPDFYLDSWRVYLGQTAALWTKNDLVKILDEKGELIGQVK